MTRTYYDALLRTKEKEPHKTIKTTSVGSDGGVLGYDRTKSVEVECDAAVEKYFGRVHQFNAIDAYNAKLERVRNDPRLAEEFDSICEERIAILIEHGRRSEAAAEQYVASIDFLVEALLHV